MRSISTGVAKKGLHPGSIYHFRLDETSGLVLTDSVEGAVITETAPNYFGFGTPNAVRWGYLNDGNARGVYTGYGSAQAKYHNKGQAVIYSCFRSLPLGDASQEGAINAKRLGNIVDEVGAGAGNEDALSMYYQLNKTPPSTGTPAQSLTVYKSGVDVGSVVAIGSEPDPAEKHFYSKLVSFALVIDIGIPSVPRLFWQDGYSPTMLGAETFSNVRFSPQAVGMVRCDGYVSGVVLLSDDVKVTDSDLIECAKWHSINAPKGNKDVSPIWHKYKAGF